MAAFNLTLPKPSLFILNGIPGLEAAHIWISIPFSIFYIISLIGNFTIVFVVSKEQTLHKPMYLLICMLALTEIALSTCIVPKALGIFWFNIKDITVDGCFTQILFYNAFGNMQSAVLLTMAFDRYVAICHPLRYTTILTNERIALLGLLGMIRSVLLVLPQSVVLWRLPFCENRVIPQTYCEHIAVVKIACVDTTVYRTYSVVITFLIIGLDLTLIGLSYVLILRAILNISLKKGHQKALNTCTAHISVLLTSYSVCLFCILIQTFGQGIPAHVHILLANFYILAPPMLNPIIYGVKTKEIQEKMGKYICRMISPGD